MIDRRNTLLTKHANDAKVAAEIAKEVAIKASEVAERVVLKAEQTAEKVLLFSQTMEYIQKDIAEIKLKLDNHYVTKEEFVTVKNITYGLVSLILIAVVGGLMTLLLK